MWHLYQANTLEFSFDRSTRPLLPLVRPERRKEDSLLLFVATELLQHVHAVPTVPGSSAYPFVLHTNLPTIFVSGSGNAQLLVMLVMFAGVRCL